MRREYTKIEYTSPVETMGAQEAQPPWEVLLGIPTVTDGLGTKLTLWGCPDCGTLVWDQQAHDKWHARR